MNNILQQIAAMRNKVPSQGIGDFARGYMQTPGEFNTSSSQAEQLGNSMSNAPTPLAIGDDILKTVPIAAGFLSGLKQNKFFAKKIPLDEAKVIMEDIMKLRSSGRNINDYISGDYKTLSDRIINSGKHYLGSAGMKNKTADQMAKLLEDLIKYDYNIK